MRAFLPRALVTGLILATIFWWLPMDEVWRAMTSVGWPLWLTVLCVFGLGHVAAAFKWWGLVRTSCPRVSYPEALRAHLAGLFANIWLPSVVGGDVVRAGWIAQRHGISAPVLIGLADRVLDLLALLALATTGLLLVGPAGGETPEMIMGAALLVLAGGVILISLFAFLVTRTNRSERLRIRLEEPLQVMAALRSAPQLSLANLVISILVQVSFVWLNYLLGSAVGIQVTFGVWLMAWPLAKIVALAPVSLGGLGVREAALAALLAPFVVTATLAIAQALIWQSILFGFGLISGLFSVLFWKVGSK